MKPSEAYTYYGSALGYLRTRRQARGPVTPRPPAEAAEGELPPPPPVSQAEAVAAAEDTVAVGVEEWSDEARIGVRVERLDGPTQAAIERMRAAGAIPDDAEVLEVGRLFAFGASDRVTPLQAGVACAHFVGSPGTLGCILRRGNDLLLLSANHVLAQANLAGIGDSIVQPTATAADHREIATLTEYERLEPTGNLMDAAIATLTVTDVSERLFNGKRIANVRTAPLMAGDRVFKFGQATGERSGVVKLSTASNVPLRIGAPTFTFDSQIEIEVAPGSEPFSCGGDSGALVYDEDDLAVGIVIGGNCARQSYVTPIAPLLTRFKAVLA